MILIKWIVWDGLPDFNKKADKVQHLTHQIPFLSSHFEPKMAI